MKTTILACLTILVFCSCSDKKKPVDANAMRDDLAASFELSWEANSISQPPSGASSFKMSDSDESRMLSLLDQSIAKGEGLDPKFLKWLHPDMPSAFKDQYIKGQKLYARGIREEDVSAQIEGNELMMKWQRFWESNKEQITAKMYPG